MSFKWNMKTRNERKERTIFIEQKTKKNVIDARRRKKNEKL